MKCQNCGGKCKKGEKICPECKARERRAASFPRTLCIIAAALVLVIGATVFALNRINCSSDAVGSQIHEQTGENVSGTDIVSDTDEEKQTGFVEFMSGTVWYGYVGETFEPVISVSDDGAVTSSYLSSFFFGEGAQCSMHFYENSDGTGGLRCEGGDAVYDIPLGSAETDSRASDLFINDVQMYLYFNDSQVNDSFYMQHLFRVDTGVNQSLSTQIIGTWANESATFVFNNDVDPSTGFGSGEWNDESGDSSTLWATLGDNVVIFLIDDEYDIPQTFAAIAGQSSLNLARWEVYNGEITWVETDYPSVN